MEAYVCPDVDLGKDQNESYKQWQQYRTLGLVEPQLQSLQYKPLNATRNTDTRAMMEQPNRYELLFHLSPTHICLML